jgi:hypothetical protein
MGGRLCLYLWGQGWGMCLGKLRCATCILSAQQDVPFSTFLTCLNSVNHSKMHNSFTTTLMCSVKMDKTKLKDQANLNKIEEARSFWDGIGAHTLWLQSPFFFFFFTLFFIFYLFFIIHMCIQGLGHFSPLPPHPPLPPTPPPPSPPYPLNTQQKLFCPYF